MTPGLPQLGVFAHAKAPPPSNPIYDGVFAASGIQMTLKRLDFERHQQLSFRRAIADQAAFIEGRDRHSSAYCLVQY